MGVGMEDGVRFVVVTAKEMNKMMQKQNLERL